MTVVFSGFEEYRKKPDALSIHDKVLDARQLHGMTDRYFEGRNPEPGI